MVLRLFRGSSARMCVSIFATNILSKKQSFDVTPSANFMTPSANPISGVWYESAHVSPILWWTGTSCNSEKRKKSVRQSQWRAPPMVLHLFRRSSARMCLSILPTNISKKQSFDVTPSANFMTPSANPISGVWYESVHEGPIHLWTGTSSNSEKSVRQSQWPAPPMVLRLFHRSSARMCLSNVATNILSKKQSFDVTPSANFMTPSANPISRVWY